MEIKQTVLYHCPVCDREYELKQLAEECAVPRKPLFQVGDVVAIAKTCHYANPAFDDWFGGEEPFDTYPKGGMAQISEVTVENKVYDVHKPHPEFVYHLTKASFTYGGQYIHEHNLVSGDTQSKRNLKKIIQLNKQRDRIESELRGISDGSSS